MEELDKFSFINNVESDPRNKEIDLDLFPNLKIKFKEIYNCFIKGTYNGNLQGNNVVMTTLQNFLVTNFSLEAIDWKDSTLKDCKFSNVSFDNSAVINCDFLDSIFERCHFKYCSNTGSSYRNTVFIDCDLSMMVIENAHFYNCSFINCITSNKLFEHSLIIDCDFKNMDIQLHTITENFGITNENLFNCNIRKYGIKEKHETLNNKNIEDMLTDLEFESIFKFKLEHFLNPSNILNGSPLFDDIFKIEKWLYLCKSQTTFLNLYKLLYDFLIISFNKNNTPLFTLIKFQYLTEMLCNSETVSNNYEIYPILIGYNISLSRIIGQYIHIIDDYVSKVKKDDGCIPVTMLVEGPLDKHFYYKEIKQYVPNVQIVNVKKQNSPNWLDVIFITCNSVGAIASLISFISLFIKTRTQSENKKISIRLKGENNIVLISNEGNKSKPNNDSINIYNESSNDSKMIITKYFSESTNTLTIKSDTEFNYSSAQIGDFRNIFKSIEIN